MIRFLSEKHSSLLSAMIPQAMEYSQHRFCSYLSFYLSFSSKHLYYCPELLSSKALEQQFRQPLKSSLVPHSFQMINTQQLLARQLLGINFQEHLLDEQGVLRWYSDIHKLLAINKKDIIEEFLKSKCRVDSSDRLKVLNQITPLARRTFYIAFKGSLPDSSVLQQKLTMNPFYQLRNTNKVLFFAQTAETSLQLPQPLQNFCREFDIKIKLLKNNTLKGMLEYLYVKSRKNVLIHEFVNQDKSVYELEAQEKGDKGKKGKGEAQGRDVETSRLNSRFVPHAIMVLSQRLPKQTLVKDNKGVILEKMRRILNTPENKNLVNQTTLSFQQLEKSYIYQAGADGQDEVVEGKFGFSVRQYVTKRVYERNRAPEINRGNPFSERKAKST